MMKFCQPLGRVLTEVQCLEQISKIRSNFALDACRRCVHKAYEKMPEPQKLAYEQPTVSVQPVEPIHAVKPIVQNMMRHGLDLGGLRLPPSRVCHSCGAPSHDFECKACQAKRHEKGAWA